MAKKVLSCGVVGLLTLALLAGTAYILLNPTEAQAERGTTSGQGQGQGRARSEIWQNGEGVADGTATYSQGGLGGGNSGGVGAYDGRGRSSGAGQGRNETVRSVEWETLTGSVTSLDGDVTLQTAEGEVLVGMGQAAYWEDFALEVGEEIAVIGFYEDGEFKAGTVENLTTGETIILRDEGGRPMWSGSGRLKNQGTAGNQSD